MKTVSIRQISMGPVLITGANGLLGQFLVKALLERGYAVAATGKGGNRLLFPEGNTQQQENARQAVSPESGSVYPQYIDMDFTEPERVRAVLESVRPSVIVHGGAMTQVDPCELDPAECYRVNVEGTRTLLAEAARIGARFIFVSTDFVFDGSAGPYTEADEPRPLSVYGDSKWKAEGLVQESALDWSIVRTILVYGTPFTGTRSNIITWAKTNLEQGQAIKVVSDQWRTPTYVGDLAQGITLMIGRQAKGIYHISGKDLLTPYDMAFKTASVLDLDVSLLQKVDASTFTQPGRRPARTGFVIDKAIRDLGYAPVSFEEGIRLTLGLRRDV
jgi:dTDP-4-dehydrorhamnose reductase